MNNTSVQAAPSASVTTGLTASKPIDGAEIQPGAKHPDPFVLQALKAVASLKLTVVLFALSLILVFYGTVAQIDNGIWTIVRDYFRSFVVWIPLQLSVQFLQVFFSHIIPKSLTIPGSIPFPGGWTLGILLLVNLLAAHLVRFKLSWKRSGVLILHAGLVLMMVGEIVTGLYAIEGNMAIAEGQTTNVVVHNRQSELAIIDRSDKKEDQVTVVPGSVLQKGEKISNDKLPFDITLVKWFVNSRLQDLEGKEDNLATKGAGLRHKLIELGEVSGVATKQTVDTPGCYLELTAKDGTPLGTYAFSIHLVEQAIKVDGKTYDVSLRFKETYKPYSLKLLEFRFDRFPGTDKPKNFSSRVVLIDPEFDEQREVVIRMNEPLRHRGETFYQSSWDEETETGTVLQVVRNPGWLLPYFSCGVVTLGMCIHFGLNLTNFLRRRAES